MTLSNNYIDKIFLDNFNKQLIWFVKISFQWPGKGGLGGGDMGYGGDNNLDGYMDMSTQRMPPSTDLSRGDFGNSLEYFFTFL